MSFDPDKHKHKHKDKESYLREKMVMGAEGSDRVVVAEREDITLFDAWKSISSVGVSIFLSFTISLAVFLISIYLAKMASALNGTDVLAEEELDSFYASVGLNPTYFNAILAVAIALLFGVTPYASNQQGVLQKAREGDEPEPEEDIKRIEDTISFINLVASSSSVVLSVPVLFCYLFSEDILQALGQGDLTSEFSSASLVPWAAAVPPILLRIANEQIFVSAGKQRDATIIDWVAFSVAAVLAYCLPVLVWADRDFMWRISAVSWCFAVEAWLTAAFNVIYMLCQPDLKKLPLFREWRFELVDKRTALKAMASQSGPSLLNTITEFLMSFLVTMLAGLISVTGQAALSYSMQLFNLTFLISLAMAFASATLAGKAAGAGDVQHTQQYFRAAHIASLWIVGSFSLVTMIYPRWIVEVFSSDFSMDNASGTAENMSATSMIPFHGAATEAVSEDLYHENDILARLMSVVILLDTWRFTGVALMRSQGSPWLALVQSSGGQLIGLALGVILGFCTDMGVAGLMVGWIAAGVLANAGLLPQVLYYCRREQIEGASKRVRNPSCKEIGRVCRSVFGRAANRDSGRSVGLQEAGSTAKATTDVGPNDVVVEWGGEDDGMSLN